LPLLREAYRLHLLEDLQEFGSNTDIRINTYQNVFLSGGWLELYVWNEARQLNVFSDCQWNQKLFNPEEPDSKKNKYELDVVLIYKAQLIVIECKTGREAFQTDKLHKFYSVSHALGGEFVTGILVTSLLAKNADPNFRERADEKGVYVVDRENLKAIKQIIKEQAMHPKKPRI
jgi:Domain of unknown function (DUF1887).